MLICGETQSLRTIAGGSSKPGFLPRATAARRALHELQDRHPAALPKVEPTS